MARQQEQTRRYEVFASAGTGEPGTGDHAGDLGADVVAALRYLAEMSNQRLQLRPSRGQQSFAVKFGAKSLVFGGHALSVADTGQATRRASRFESAEPTA